MYEGELEKVDRCTHLLNPMPDFSSKNISAKSACIRKAELWELLVAQY